MGRKRRKKHPSWGSSGGTPDGGGQSTLPSHDEFRHLKKSDLKDFLIPVIKEIGKTIYPPVAVPIELLYQVYKHAGAIKEVSAAVMRGDYNQAIKVVAKEVVKEGADAMLGSAMSPQVTAASNQLADNVQKNLETDEKGKEIVGNVLKGTVKGVAEASRDKLVDKTVDEVLKNE